MRARPRCRIAKATGASQHFQMHFSHSCTYLSEDLGSRHGKCDKDGPRKKAVRSPNGPSLGRKRPKWAAVSVQVVSPPRNPTYDPVRSQQQVNGPRLATKQWGCVALTPQIAALLSRNAMEYVSRDR